MKDRSIAFFALLWRFTAWTWSILIVGIIIGVLGSAAYTYITTGSITFADPHSLTVILFLRTHPYHVALVLTLILFLTLCAYMAHRSQHVTLQGEEA